MNSEQEIDLFADKNHDPFSNGEVFDESAVVYQPDVDEQKQLYWLKRHIVASFRKANITNNFAKDYADRNGLSILRRAKERALPAETAIPTACNHVECGCH